MGTLEKLKAYFGMVPADEHLSGYDLPEEYAEEGYAPPRREPRGYRAAAQPREDDYDEYDEPPARMPTRTRAARRVEDLDDIDVPVRGRVRGTSPAPVSAGALAIDRAPEPVSRLRPVEQPAMTRDPLSRIVTLHPAGYAEARGIGEAFRDGNPVIMNLTQMDNADAKRLVDFAAGLAFALRGSMDKVTNKVFLLSPSDADVSAEDRQRIAEGGLFLRR